MAKIQIKSEKLAFFVIAFIFALIGLAMGDTTIFQKIVDSTIGV